jgi:hypothetical protein
MTQEERNLLLKDLCARLPYRTLISIGSDGNKYRMEEIRNALISIDTFKITIDGYDIEHIKPYLFPISSMTEEQYNSLYESGILDNCSHNYEYVNPHIYGVSFIFKQFKTYSLELIEWLNKNHFDYRGLISMGLAIDATNLNIY